MANQAIQYLLAKIIADKTGLAYTPPPDFVDKRGSPVKWTNEPVFTMKPSPGRILCGNPHVIDTLQCVNLDLIDGTKPVHVKQCYFQIYGQFRDYKRRIRKDWLFIPSRRYVRTDPDAVYIHARRTDYCEYHPDFIDPRNQGAATTLEEYAVCLERFPDARKIVVVTDDPTDEYLQGFGQFGLPWEISGRAWDQDFLLLASCRNLIISQSTFSWLAAFLGRSDKIVCPCFPGSFWHRGLTDNRYPNLFVDDDPPGIWEWVTT